MVLDRLKNASACLAGAILVNLLLLLGAPLLSQRIHLRPTSPLKDAFLLAPPQSLELPPPTKRLRPKPQPPKKLPQPPMVRETFAPPKPQLDITVPVPQFEINPKLTLGMALPDVPSASPAAPSQGLLTGAFELGEVDQEPRLVRRVNPMYPFQARKRGVEGKVKVKFLIDTQGHVSHLSIIKAEPAGVFDKSVLRAVRRWRFKPGMVEGKPVDTWVVLPLTFKLDE
jgi:protein TonB